MAIRDLLTKIRKRKDEVVQNFWTGKGGDALVKFQKSPYGKAAVGLKDVYVGTPYQFGKQAGSDIKQLANVAKTSVKQKQLPSFSYDPQRFDPVKQQLARTVNTAGALYGGGTKRGLTMLGGLSGINTAVESALAKPRPGQSYLGAGIEKTISDIPTLIPRAGIYAAGTKAVEPLVRGKSFLTRAGAFGAGNVLEDIVTQKTGLMPELTKKDMAVSFLAPGALEGVAKGASKVGSRIAQAKATTAAKQGKDLLDLAVKKNLIPKDKSGNYRIKDKWVTEKTAIEHVKENKFKIFEPKEEMIWISENQRVSPTFIRRIAKGDVYGISEDTVKNVQKWLKAGNKVPPKPPYEFAGAVAGVEPEFDEEGKPTGVKYNPVKGALGVGAMAGVKGKGLNPGDWVKSSERGNYGKIWSINPDTQTAKVRFTNKKEGTTALVDVALDKLSTTSRGAKGLQKEVPTIKLKSLQTKELASQPIGVKPKDVEISQVVPGVSRTTKNVDPSKIATRTLANGKKVPAVRQSSGVYAEKEFETHVFKDKHIGKTDNLLSASTTADNVMEHEISKKGMGPLARMYFNLRETVAQQTDFRSEYKQKIGQSFRKAQLGQKDRAIVADILDGKNPSNAKDKHHTAAKEIRGYLDELHKRANEVRKAMGKSEIGYIKEYLPHMRKTSAWIDLLGDPRTTISENMDYIVPNQKKNPHAERRIAEELAGREKDLFKIIDKYVDAISNDIYLTPQIEKIKAVRSVLDGRGYDKMSGFLNTYVRENLIGKPSSLDNSLKLGGKGARAVMGKISQARNLGALTLNVLWSLRTQPASIINTFARTNRDFHGIFSWFDPKIQKEIMEMPTMRNKMSKGIGTTLGGDVDRAATNLYRSPIDKYNDTIAMLGNAVEKHLTGMSIAAGLKRADRMGMKGSDKKMYAQYIGEVTQSMYDNIGRPQTLNSKFARMVFPFQTFAHEMFRYARTLAGKGGGIPLQQRERFGQAVSLVVGTYLYNQYAEKVFGSKVSSAGSFIPFAGSYVDQKVEDVKGMAMGALDIEGENKSKVGRATGRAPVAPLEDVEKLTRAIDVYVKHKNIQPLRKELVFWGMGLAGLGGATQINRTIDGLIAMETGYSASDSGRMRFLVDGKAESARALLGGPFQTKAGQEYIKGSAVPYGDKQTDFIKTLNPEARKKLTSYINDKRKEGITVSLSPRPEAPKLTGKENLDKDTISKYKSDLTKWQKHSCNFVRCRNTIRRPGRS
jgi:hypothetical protein